MKFGLRYCNTGRYVDAKEAVALAQAAETVGFESLWTVEHTIVPAGYASAYPYDPSGKMAGGRNDMPLPDPLIWMAFVAAATTKIKLATGILILPQHNPVLAAKQIATLDHLSRGRTLLGVGVGWLQEEFAALGVPFAERGARMDEYIAAMRDWSMSQTDNLLKRIGAGGKHVDTMIAVVMDALADGPKTQQDLLARAKQKASPGMRAGLTP